jgi:hypothetical protein
MSGKSDAEALALREKIKSTPDTLKASNKTYYVSNKGSDNSNGNSQDKPWATIEKVNSFSFKAGDVVLFERGSIFRGHLKPWSNVSYGAYGTGDKPCIYGSADNYAKAEWKHKGGNIWVCQKKIPADAGIIVFNHGENTGIKKLSRNYLTENFDFFYNSREKLVYLYFIGESPSSAFESIEIGDRDYLIYFPNNAVNITIENLALKYGGGHGIFGDGAGRITIRGCEIGWIGGSIQFEDTRFGNGIENWEDVNNFTVEYCYLYQIYDAAITHQGQSPVIMDNVTFRNNLIEYCTYSIEYFQGDENGMMTDILYENNIMRFAGYGWGNQRPDKAEAAHIKSWGLPNRAERFVIKNNVLDTSRYNLFDIGADSGDKYLPLVEGNTFIQNKDGAAGNWGEHLLTLDNDGGKAIKDMDKNSIVIVY